MSDIVDRLRAIDFTKEYQLSPLLIVIDAADEIERLRAQLAMIARMKVFPDDVINRMTLAAAIRIAREPAFVDKIVSRADDRRDMLEPSTPDW
jgi:hypothetical protein